MQREPAPRPDSASEALDAATRATTGDGPAAAGASRQVHGRDLVVLALAVVGTNGWDAGLPLLGFLALVVACSWVFTWRPERPGGWRDGVRVVGAWALPVVPLVVGSGLASLRREPGFLAGLAAAVVAGVALASGDGRRRWACVPLALTFVLAVDPWGADQSLFALGVALVLLATATAATVAQAVHRWRPSPATLGTAPGEAPPWARGVSRAVLGVAIAKTAGLGVAVLIFGAARPLRALRARTISTAIVLTLGAWAWAFVVWAQTRYAQELFATGSFDQAYEAARQAVVSPDAFVRRSALAVTFVAALAGRSLRQRLVSGAVAAALGGVALALEGAVYSPLVLDGEADVDLFLQYLPRSLLGCGPWALLGVAVGEASDRLVDSLPLRAHGSERVATGSAAGETLAVAPDR